MRERASPSMLVLEVVCDTMSEVGGSRWLLLAAIATITGFFVSAVINKTLVLQAMLSFSHVGLMRIVMTMREPTTKIMQGHV